MTALGLDTSNYTTSAALFHACETVAVQKKKLLPVEEGKLGLRQSDAVFHHVKQLPDMVTSLRDECDAVIDCVGASDRPQQTEGSYMPCFLVGVGAAKEIAACLRVPMYTFTHQQGHVAAALYSAKRLPLLRERFLAFHVSGGTTDALLVEPDEEQVIRCQVIARSKDLKAGQLIDRVGGMLGLPFPAGPSLEQLANKSNETYRPKASMDGMDCHLSGVQNQCEAMLKRGIPDADVAQFCMQSVQAALTAMMMAVQDRYGPLPVVYAGGVMSNRALQESLSTRFGGWFAEPALSADNAVGIAVLTAVKHTGNIPEEGIV